MNVTGNDSVVPTAVEPSIPCRRDTLPEDDFEAARMLRSIAHGKTRRIASDLLVNHVMVITAHAGWPVRRAAMEAILRRLQFAERDELKVATRPPRGKPFGLYSTRCPGGGERPYRSLLASIHPLRGSCDCADFLRSSLGLCKHLLVILGDVALRDRGFRRSKGSWSPGPGKALLAWDPLRPLSGAGDSLERLWLVKGGENGAVAHSCARLEHKWFTRDRGGESRLRFAHSDEPATRLGLVRDLLGSLAGNGAGGLVAEPAAQALLKAERQRLELVAANLAGFGSLRAALRGLKRKLYPYQLEGVERFLASGRLLLADDMGLGKTAQAIAACHALLVTGRVERGLVIVPASLKPQWLREWQFFTDASVAVVEGPPGERKRTYRSRSGGFLIVNYEQVLRDLDLMRAFEPSIIVLDEAQRIKNWATRTAMTVKTLKPRFRLVLTGTPMENRLDELASLLDFLDDPALEPKWRLAPWHSTQADGKREVVGARDLGTLRTRLRASMLRRVRSEVLKQLPERTDTVVPVEFTDAQRVEHDALNQPIAQLAATARRRPLTQTEFLRLMSLLTTQRVIANGIAQYQFERVWDGISRVARPDEALLRSLSTPKLAELRQIVAQVAVEQGRKIVVFSQWRRMLRLAHWAVADLLADAGLRAVFFTGEEGQRQRTRNIVDFHDERAARMLFATDAGGVGLNLQRAASCCINLELPWNPAVLEQRVGRIHRLGQKRPIDVYNLVTESSIEAKIGGLVADKKALFAGLFDGTSDEVRFDRSASFLGQLSKITEAAPVLIANDPEQELDALSDDREVERAIDAGDGGDLPAPAARAEIPVAAPASAEVVVSARQVEEIFAGLEVRARAGGGLVIEAPAETASALLAMFRGMASLLGTVRA
jgi:superfamily II DNA or RNA helicase